MSQQQQQQQAAPIRIVRLCHMRYKHADIETMHTFLIDFGMTLVEKVGKKRFYAGQGPDPYVYIAEEVCRRCCLQSRSRTAVPRSKAGRDDSLLS